MTEVKRLREKAGLTQAEAADLLDMPKRTFESYDRGEREPPYQKMDRIRRLLGNEEAKEGHGDGSRVLVLPSDKNASSEPVIRGNERRKSLPLVSVAPGASGDSDVWEVTMRDYLEMDSEVLASGTGVPVEKLAVMKVSGDSMGDTLRAGDKAIVHREPPESIAEGAVYVWVGEHQGVVIRRARWMSGSVLELVSDDDRYQPIQIDLTEQSDWHCIGQIVRVMHPL
jgi:phage repressor protein C with HTH and peptisase S24 domain